MKTQLIVGVAVMAMGSAVAVTTAGWGGGVRLPLPQAAAGAQRSTGPGVGGPAGSRPGSTPTGLPSGAVPAGSGASGGTSDPPLSYVSSPLIALTGCAVGVSDPAPPRGQTAETATVSTAAGAEVRLEADYFRTRSVHSGIASGSGEATFTLSINHAEPGITVRVTATVSLRGVKDSCSTSFTPVDPIGASPSTGGGQ